MDPLFDVAEVIGKSGKDVFNSRDMYIASSLLGAGMKEQMRNIVLS